LRELFDLREGGLEAVPLRFVLFAAFGFGEGVREGGGVGPEFEFAEGGLACEELYDIVISTILVWGLGGCTYVENRANEQFLLR